MRVGNSRANTRRHSKTKEVHLPPELLLVLLLVPNPPNPPLDWLLLLEPKPPKPPKDIFAGYAAVARVCSLR